MNEGRIGLHDDSLLLSAERTIVSLFVGLLFFIGTVSISFLSIRGLLSIGALFVAVRSGLLIAFLPVVAS